MRIIAGSLGGRRIVAPPGTGTRPTPERVREAVFAALGSVEGARVLDLFAGSGALGIEALSRGAAVATLVDRSSAAVRVIRRNVDALALGERCRIERADWRRVLEADATAETRYDIAFLDPPYDRWPELGGDLGPALAGVLSPDARVVAEHPVSEAPSLQAMRVERRRAYGDTGITEMTVVAG